MSRHFHRRYQPVDMEPMDDSSDNNSSNQTWLNEGPSTMQLKRSEMNELIMDYLVHEGFKEAAERFREEAGIESANLRFENQHLDYNDDASSTLQQTNGEVEITNNNNGINNNNIIDHTNQKDRRNTPTSANQSGLSDTKSDRLAGLNNWLSKTETPEMMDKRIKIRHLIEEGDILKGQSQINIYYPELLDNHRNIYFKLQQQHLIELIRQQKINEVLSYVHDQLSVDELKDLGEMERTLALLAYEHPDKSPYASLLQTSHRLQLASDINDIILQETTGNVEPNKPRLVTLLKLLFWTQSELERKKVHFPKMTDLVNGTIADSVFPLP